LRLEFPFFIKRTTQHWSKHYIWKKFGSF
jgi:hypothetical protein